MKELTLIEKAFLLKSTPLFEMLDLDLLLIVSDKLGTLEVDPGDPLFVKGEPASRMYFIAEGSIEISDEKRGILATLKSPDFFGDEALLSDKPRGYNAKSKEMATLLTLSKTNLLTVLSECPQVAIGLLQSYTSYYYFRPRKEGL